MEHVQRCASTVHIAVCLHSSPATGVDTICIYCLMARSFEFHAFFCFSRHTCKPNPNPRNRLECCIYLHLHLVMRCLNCLLYMFISAWLSVEVSAHVASGYSTVHQILVMLPEQLLYQDRDSNQARPTALSKPLQNQRTNHMFSHTIIRSYSRAVSSKRPSHREYKSEAKAKPRTTLARLRTCSSCANTVMSPA